MECITYGHELFSYNLLNFFAKFDVVSKKLAQKLHPYIIRIKANFSSNSNGNSFDKCCEYQLIKYKLWHTNLESACYFEKEGNMMFILKGKEFLQSNLRKSIIPYWQRHLDSTLK